MGQTSTTQLGKGNTNLGFIRRNLKNCTKKVNAGAYTSMVRPKVEYASTFWDTVNLKNIKSLEQKQKRAARFVCSDYNCR